MSDSDVSDSNVQGGFVRVCPGPVAIDEIELRAALEVAGEACDRAREEILPRFRKVAVETKGDGSPVTEADRAAERAIRSVIETNFPQDAILGEEFGEKVGDEKTKSRRRWTIDPIDGTIAFSRGIPLFTTLVALLVDDEPVLGMIDLPAANDRIHGYRGGGVWRGQERLTVSRASELERAMVCHGDLFCFDNAGLRSLYDALAQRVRILRGYTDAFGHLLVLSGAAEAMVDCDLNPWDAAVTRVLAHEAGGVCWVREREQGRKLDLLFGNEAIVGSIGDLWTPPTPA
jgi:histidinol phosphatase-like enzyme (inositol monophosphatase family)